MRSFLGLNDSPNPKDKIFFLSSIMIKIRNATLCREIKFVYCINVAFNKNLCKRIKLKKLLMKQNSSLLSIKELRKMSEARVLGQSVCHLIEFALVESPWHLNT